jgi:hypothetical protein
VHRCKACAGAHALDDLRHVVRVVGEAVQRERRVVLEVLDLAAQQVEQRLQHAHRKDARLVVGVLREAAKRKGGHLAERAVVRLEHVDQRRHGAALHNFYAVVLRLHAAMGLVQVKLRHRTDGHLGSASDG